MQDALPTGAIYFDPGADFDLATQTFLRACQAKGLSEFTVEFYRDYLADFRKFLNGKPDGVPTPPVEITPEHLRRFARALQQRQHNGKPVEPRTVNVRLATVKVFFRHLYEEQYLPTNPAERLQLVRQNQKPVQALTEAQVAALLEVCKPTTFEGLRDAAMIKLMVDTGIRRRELLSLTVADVDFVEQMVTVQRGKNRRSRTIPFGRACRQALWRYLQQRDRRAATPLLFVNRSGEPLSPQTLVHRVADLGKRAGIPHCGCHRLRHTMATLFLRNGGDPYSLQTLLGHSTMDMTRRYLTITATDLRESHRKASPLDRMTIR